MDIFLTHLLATEEMIPATARTKEGLKKAWYEFLAEQNWGQFRLAGYTLKLDNELKTEIEKMGIKIAPKLPIQPAPSINQPSAMSVPPQLPVVQLRAIQETTTKQTETTLSPKQAVGQKPQIARKPDLSRNRSFNLGANPLVTPVPNTAVTVTEAF